MVSIYKALSALLSYPTEELQSAAADIAAVLQLDEALPSATRHALVALTIELRDSDLLDLQSRYIDLFDRSRSLSLHLFEHVHGESRDRGQAMVDLRERYRAAGLDLASNELPDYLPLFLEFLSVLPNDEAGVMLAEAGHVLPALTERLTSRSAPYAMVFAALEALSRAAPDKTLLDEMRATKADDPNDLAALDRAWEEAEVRFGPEAGCSRTATRKRPEVTAS